MIHDISHSTMRSLTISLDTDLELRFMDILSQQRKDLNDSIDQAVNEAIELWIDEQEQHSQIQDLLSIMEEGYPLGSYHYSQRSELYDQS